jgi:hypothetical protein
MDLTVRVDVMCFYVLGIMYNNGNRINGFGNGW